MLCASPCTPKLCPQMVGARNDVDVVCLCHGRHSSSWLNCSYIIVNLVRTYSYQWFTSIRINASKLTVELQLLTDLTSQLWHQYKPAGKFNMHFNHCSYNVQSSNSAVYYACPFQECNYMYLCTYYNHLCFFFCCPTFTNPYSYFYSVGTIFYFAWF